VGYVREGVDSDTRHEPSLAVHAEQNSIIQAAIRDISIDGSAFYCTDLPCILCNEMMINSLVNSVVY